MTLQEVAQQLGKSESTIYKNFKRTQESLLKKGIILTRWGTDDYEIEYEEEESEKTYLQKLREENQKKYREKKLERQGE